MSKVNWTKDQQKVIDLQDRNILVSAAAGSGKTAVLVERIIQEITREKDPMDIDRMLVVTFTKAAAAEMRNRIGEALEKKLQEEPQNQHIQKQASLLHTAQITTIDSFCQSIIRNYFHVINLDPVFRVGDETDLEITRKEILHDLIEEKYKEAREKGEKDFLYFTEVFSTGRTDSAIEEMVLHLYDISTSYPWPKEWLEECMAMYQVETVDQMENLPWMKELIKYVQVCIGEFYQMARQAERICLETPEIAPYQEAIASDLSYLSSMLELNTYKEFQERLQLYHPARLKAIRGEIVEENKKEMVKSLRESYNKNGLATLQEKFFYQPMEEMFQDIQKMAPAVKELIGLTLEFRQAFAQKKREDGILDFADMEHFALEILVKKEGDTIEPSQTAKELQEYYTEILTDEYQDSNYVQDLLLSSLCRAPEQKPYLFMVGDVKQSVYKFRLARPELFIEKYNSYTVGKGPYERIDLCQNFRSRASVLESANYIFQQIMVESLGGIVYDQDAKLVPGATFEKCEHRTATQTELLLVEQEGMEGKVDKKTLEAGVIGEQIRQLVNGADPMYVKSKEGYRPIKYGDIAILLRSLSGWSEEFIEVLSDMGIPAYADTKTGYFSSLEVKTILNFLHIIDNPRQDIPLAAVLRSCLVGITDEELGWIGTRPAGPDFWDKVHDVIQCEEENLEALQDKLREFIARMDEYYEYAKTRSVYELLRKIYQDTGYYEIMSAMPAGEKRKANLDILLQQSIEFAQNGHEGIYNFARYIENLQKSNIDFGEASVNGEHTDAVRIMTIHKSKGLEFPVVFIAGMGKKFNLTDARKGTIIDADMGIGCDYVDLDLRVKEPTLIKKVMANHITLGTLEEEIRVLYVAMTRAKEKMYILGSAANIKGKIEKWLYKGENLTFYQLRNAQTYLDWIVPAVANRTGIKMRLRNFLEREEETRFIGDKKLDELYGISVYTPEDIIQDEKINRKNREQEKKQLLSWDENAIYDPDMRHSMEKQAEFVYGYEEEADLPVKISVSELKRRAMEQAESIAVEETAQTFLTVEENAQDGADIPKPKFLDQEREITGAARGTLYHLVMEHFPYEQIRKDNGEWGEKEFARYLQEMVQKGYMRQGEPNQLSAGKFVRFMDSAIGKRMAQAQKEGTLRLEQPFMLGIPANEIYKEKTSEAMIMVQGIIDGYFYEGDEIVLVDYKTDHVKRGQEQKLVERYKEQLRYYAKALEQLTQKKVKEKIIYSFALGKEIPL